MESMFVHIVTQEVVDGFWKNKIWVLSDYRATWKPIDFEHYRKKGGLQGGVLNLSHQIFLW